MNRWLIASLGLVVVSLSAGLMAYFGFHDRLAADVPVHWGASGAPDRFLPKDEALWSLLTPSLVMAGVVLMGRLLPWLSPKQFEIDAFRGTYEYLMFLLVAFFAVLQGLTLAAAFEPALDVGRWIIAGAYLLFALLGNVLGKVQRNFWVGVRTPWTLASETVWTRTHRVAAWLFVGGGMAGFVATLVGVSGLWLFVGVIAVIALGPILYSLVLYKRLERLGKL